MGIVRVQLLDKHLSQDTPTSSLIKSNIKALELEAGISKILSAASFPLADPYLHTCTWLRVTLKFMQEHNIVIDIQRLYLVRCRRHNQAFMLAFLEHTSDATILYPLHICCLCLQTSFLFDITTGDGDGINHSYFELLVLLATPPHLHNPGGTCGANTSKLSFLHKVLKLQPPCIVNIN